MAERFSVVGMAVPDVVAAGLCERRIAFGWRFVRPARAVFTDVPDGLPAYGVSSHMRRADILARVDELIEQGRLETTGGAYPVLRIAA